MRLLVNLDDPPHHERAVVGLLDFVHDYAVSFHHVLKITLVLDKQPVFLFFHEPSSVINNSLSRMEGGLRHAHPSTRGLVPLVSAGQFPIKKSFPVSAKVLANFKSIGQREEKPESLAGSGFQRSAARAGKNRARPGEMKCHGLLRRR
jgi:hypothetical protein